MSLIGYMGVCPMCRHDHVAPSLGLARVDTDKLYAALKHGDEKHQQWLKEAIEAYFDGMPVRPQADPVIAQPSPSRRDNKRRPNNDG